MESLFVAEGTSVISVRSNSRASGCTTLVELRAPASVSAAPYTVVLDTLRCKTQPFYLLTSYYHWRGTLDSFEPSTLWHCQ